MSKSFNRCQHIFQRGPYKGEKCYKCCDGDFCSDHIKIIHTTPPTSPQDDIVSKVINNKKINTDLTKIKMEFKKLENECTKYARLYHGYALRIDPDHEIPVRKKILQEMESKEFKNNCRAEYNELDSESKKHFGHFDGYLEYSKKKFLSYPNTYIIPIPFNGSVIEANKRMNDVSIKYKNFKKQLDQLRKYISKMDIRPEQKILHCNT
jgi:hypothetical protein